MAKKGATIFDFIGGVTHNKKEWNKWSDLDKKKFSPFIVNRWLSMRFELIEFINDLQKYTIGFLKPREVYRLYHDFLPNNKGFAKYIKGKKEDKYDKKLINQIAKHYQISTSEASDYIDLLDRNYCNSILTLYGYTEKDKKSMLKGIK